MKDEQKTKSQLINELNEIRQRVSDLEQVKNNLNKSETRYRQIFETNLAIKLIINPVNGKIVEANQSACEFYGYPLETLTSMHITDINMFSDEEVEKEMEKAKKEERLFFNFSHQIASGEIRAVEVYSGPVSVGDSTLLYSIVQDVTKRKEAEQELHTYRHHLEELVEKRTLELKKKMDEQLTTFDLMIDREVRMSELKEVIKKLRAQLERAGITPKANDPLLGDEPK